MIGIYIPRSIAFRWAIGSLKDIDLLDHIIEPSSEAYYWIGSVLSRYCLWGLRQPIKQTRLVVFRATHPRVHRWAREAGLHCGMIELNGDMRYYGDASRLLKILSIPDTSGDS